MEEGMERWRGKYALVTGASAGIGYAIAKTLVESGVHVIGCARNPASLESLKSNLPPKSGSLTAVKCDLTRESNILKLFKEIEARMGHVDILVNNAGTGVVGNLVDGETVGWRTMFDLNIMATTICTREYLRLMEKDAVENGHIININSVAGHSVAPVNVGLNFYTGTKHMLTAMTKSLSTELSAKQSKVRVTSLSPGKVNTALIEEVKKHPVHGQHFQTGNGLEGSDIADAVLFVLGSPAHVVIAELTIVPAD